MVEELPRVHLDHSQRREAEQDLEQRESREDEEASDRVLRETIQSLICRDGVQDERQHRKLPEEARHKGSRQRTGQI